MPSADALSCGSKTTAGDPETLRPVPGSGDGRRGTASIVEGSGEPCFDHRVEIGDPQNGIDRQDGDPPDSDGDPNGIDRDEDLAEIDQDVHSTDGDSEDVDPTAVVLDVSLTSREEVVEGAQNKRRKQ